ncbi:MAG: TetR family transcriptional regulator [Deltaproteobacteria bacterium]|nr:TetR family transcriptional regulator [Deltaproteobacteria bacterium]
MAPGPTRRPLTTERVVAAALRLIDRDGVESLSMRRLGALLRVEAMSLYKHVPDKSALVDGVIARVLAELAPPDPAAPWDARLRHVANEFRRVALAHPHVFPLLATRVPKIAVGFAPIEAMLAAFRSAGLGDAQVLAHFWSFLAYLTGALLTETAALTGDAEASFTVPESLDPASFPELRRLAAALASCDFATEFARGVELAITAARSAASR